LERQKQAQTQKSIDIKITDSTVRIKPDINEAYDKLYHIQKNVEKLSLNVTLKDSKKNSPSKYKIEDEKQKLRLHLHSFSTVTMV